MNEKKIFEDSKWIFVKDCGEDVCNSYFDYIAELNIEETLSETVSLYLSVTTLYAVYVNDSFVDCGQYCGYENYQVYDRLDITPYLTAGNNTLKIVQYVQGSDTSTHRKEIPGVIFAVWQEGNCLLVSNQDCLSRVNPHYKRGKMEYVSGQLGFTYSYDACKEETVYVESILAGKEKKLYARPIKKLPIEKQVSGKLKTQGVFLECSGEKPVGRTMLDAYLAYRIREELLTRNVASCGWNWSIPAAERADGVYFLIDAGEESVGFLSMEFNVPQECDVLIGYGEHLEDLRVRSYVGERNFCVHYHAKAGRNTFFQPFLRLGMRYMQIHIYSKEGTLFHVGIKKTYYPLEERRMQLSDALHQKIWDVSVHTLKCCIHEHYEDCPWREQAMYAYDSRIQMLCGYYAFGEFEMPRASLRLMALSLREDGLLELVSPGRAGVNIPGFTAVFVRQMWEYLKFSGDTELADELFEVIETIVKGFADRIQDNGLLTAYEGYWNFYEWRIGLQDGLGGRYECPLNALVSDAFYCFARICERVKPQLAAQYDLLHEQMNLAIHKYFFDPVRQVYVTRKEDDEDIIFELTQALALYVGAVPQELIPAVTQNMITKSEVLCTLSGSIYKYDALLRQGDTYRGYVKKEIERIWGDMVFSGATSFWETEKGAADFGDAGSLCHGWSAVPVYLYGEYGLVPEK